MDRYSGPGLRALVIPWWMLALRDVGSGVAAAQSDDFPGCEGEVDFIGDALCDIQLNVAACGYDGGDCCECSCEDTDDYDCGKAGFFCLDPDAVVGCAPTASPTPGPTSSPSFLPYPECTGYVPHIQDGYCDPSLNSAACGWDGGDCCACTCLEGLNHGCGESGIGFDCRDPDVPSGCIGLTNFPDCEEDVSGFQDSVCDEGLNNVDCGWDGGDCCECTCREFGSTENCGMNGYDCRDPLAPTECSSWLSLSAQQTSAPSEFPECTGLIDFIGDGYCDESNNIVQCAWDGGDCCICTCAPATFSCSTSDFNCLDPDGKNCSARAITSSSDEEAAEEAGSGESYMPTPTAGLGIGLSECFLSSAIGNGYCDLGFNTRECSWDAGDCCECTCVDGLEYACGANGYACRDPKVDIICATTPSPGISLTEASALTKSSRSLSGRDIIFMLLVSMAAFACFVGIIAVLFAVIKRTCRARVPTMPAGLVPHNGVIKGGGGGGGENSKSSPSASASVNVQQDSVNEEQRGERKNDVGPEEEDWEGESKVSIEGEATA